MSAAGASWAAFWRDHLGFPAEMPLWLVSAIGLLVIYALVVLPSGALISLIDRKLGADFQARVGPNRAGPAGALQPVADLLKLLQKEPTPLGWSWRDGAWLAVQSMALYSSVAILPLGSLALAVDTDMSAFLPFWCALMLALGAMMFGLSQRSVSGWFGGARIAAQALSGAFPALVAVLSVGISAGGFRWSRIAAAQGASPLSWTILSGPPFGLIAFLVFVVSGLVLLGIPPMDASHSTADLHGGVSSSLYGRRLSLFRLGRTYAFFLWSVIAVTLFLGAWVLPPPLSSALTDSGLWWLLQLLELGWLLAKTFLLMALVIWVARVNPRARVDQATDFAWKVLSPFSLLALIGMGAWVGWSALR